MLRRWQTSSFSTLQTESMVRVSARLPTGGAKEVELSAGRTQLSQLLAALDAPLALRRRLASVYRRGEKLVEDASGMVELHDQGKLSALPALSR